MNDPRYGPKPDDPTQMSQQAKDVACGTKRRFPTKSQAKKALKELHRQGRRGLVMYECWHCNQWHHGYPPGEATYRRSGRVYG